jgi:hypothetical protein
LRGDNPGDKQCAQGDNSAGGDTDGGSDSGSRHANAATAGDLSGDEDHHGHPAGCAGQPGSTEKYEQDRADGDQLHPGADGGDHDVAGKP